MEKLLKSREVCEKLGISRWTLYKWVEEGRVRVVRLPSSMLRVLESEVEKIIKGK